MDIPSIIGPADARTILEMADVCFSEGTGPNYDPLLRIIAAQHPELIEEFDYIPVLQEEQVASTP